LIAPFDLRESEQMDSAEHPSPETGIPPASRPTGALAESLEAVVRTEAQARNFLSRDLAVRIVEQVIFVTAVVGAVALGLGITDYLSEHRYVAAYLLAYIGFRFADLLVGEDPDETTTAATGFSERVLSELPILILFAAAPFERTYLYGGEAAPWLGALGLLLELAGLWLALGSRVQLHFFSSDRTGRERMVLVKTGFFRYIRHPVYAGILLVLFAWPLVYGAWIVAVVTVIVGIVVAHRQIAADEKILLARFGEEFEEYRRTTDALIPSIW
jgi:protein-S-isoprenylcysteine O-methyltransferase Ste14